MTWMGISKLAAAKGYLSSQVCRRRLRRRMARNNGNGCATYSFRKRSECVNLRCAVKAHGIETMPANAGTKKSGVTPTRRGIGGAGSWTASIAERIFFRFPPASAPGRVRDAARALGDGKTHKKFTIVSDCTGQLATIAGISSFGSFRARLV